jgi:hypothetical protein
MDSKVEIQLSEILSKEQWTDADRKLLAEESDRYADKLAEALKRDEPDMNFQGCRIRALEPARILFVVWCLKKNIKRMSPQPYRLYNMERQSGVLTLATEIDELRHDFGFRL